MRSAFLCLALLGSSLPATAQVQPAPEEEGFTAAAETISTAEDNQSRMTVPVMINGQGPFHFIIDTGADRSVISKEVAERLALPAGKSVRLVAMGKVSSVQQVRIDSLRVSANRELKALEVPALQGRNLGADGLLGLDALKGQRILIDFAAQTMKIEPGNTKAVREEPVGRDTIIVRARSRLGQLVLVDADANGQEVWVVIGTGGQNSVANEAFRRLMARANSVGDIRPVDLVGVLGETTRADFTIVGKMRIGGVLMGNTAVAFADATPFRRFGLTKRPAMFLGIDTLRSFRKVSIDFANKQVRFQLPEGAMKSASR